MKRIFSFVLVFGWLLSYTKVQSQIKIGNIAHDFSLKNIDNTSFSLKDLSAKKGCILIFTCNSCPYSVAYEDRIIALDKKYAAKGYPVVAINPNDPDIQPKDSFSNMKKKAQKKAFTFPYLFDETQEIAKAYGATRTPHVFLLNKEEKQFRVVYIGAIDNNTYDASAADEKYVEDALENLLKGESVKVTQKKAIGCTIKWRKT